MLNSTFDHLIKDTMSLVNSFQSWSFAHTYRQGNGVAHALARRAKVFFFFFFFFFFFPFLVWIEFAPSDINNLVIADFLDSLQ